MGETMVNDSVSKLTDERRALEAERDQLAREVAQGRPGASKRLDAVLDRLEHVRRAEARAALIGEAGKDLVREQQEAEAARRQAERIAERDALKAETWARVQRVDELLAALRAEGHALREQFARLDGLARELGETHLSADRMSRALAGATGWAMNEILAGHADRPLVPYRKPITELLRAVLAPAEAPPITTEEGQP